MRQDIFAGVVQERVDTTRGGCDLPILYTDGSLLGTFFHADYDAAAALLANTCLEPLPLFGRALVSLFGWEYRKSTVGSYREVGLGIQARRRGSKPSLVRLGLSLLSTPWGLPYGHALAQKDQGIWVQNLPVSSEEAWSAGVEVWGYPKYVCEIETDFDASTRVRLGDELELEAAPMRGPVTEGFPIVTYTAREGRLIRTVIEVGHRVRWDLGSAAKLKVMSSGPTADSLRALGLEGAAPTAVFRTDVFRATLPAGKDLGPIRP